METTFFDVVAGSGGIGILIWVLIFSMWPVGVILGIASVLTSSFRETKKIPLTFKMLIILVVSYLFVGASGLIWGSITSYTAILEPTGAAKAVAMALGISNTMYTLSFTMLGMVPFLFFIAVSIIILHCRELPLTIDELMALEENQ